MTFAELSLWVERYPLLFAAIVAWSLAWKGAALWRATKRGELAWFIAVLVVNLVGILEIIYLLIVIPFKERSAKAESVEG